MSRLEKNIGNSYRSKCFIALLSCCINVYGVDLKSCSMIWASEDISYRKSRLMCVITKPFSLYKI